MFRSETEERNITGAVYFKDKKDKKRVVQQLKSEFGKFSYTVDDNFILYNVKNPQGFLLF